MLLITADGVDGVVSGTSILIVPIVAVSTSETFINDESVPSTVRFVIVPSVVRFVISNDLLIPDIIILSFFLSSYILILVISEVPLNTKVNYLGGGERVIPSESGWEQSLSLTFADSTDSILSGVVILFIPKVFLIPEIDTDDVLSVSLSSIEPITSYVEVSAVSIFDMIIPSIELPFIVLIWTFPLVNPVIDGVLVIPLTVNVGVLVLSPDL